MDEEREFNRKKSDTIVKSVIEKKKEENTELRKLALINGKIAHYDELYQKKLIRNDDGKDQSSNRRKLT